HVEGSISVPDPNGCPAGSVALKYRGRYKGVAIGGCGMFGCNARYDYPTIESCYEACAQTPRCKSFEWAPLNGDRNHVDKKVCGMWPHANPNSLWPGGDGQYHMILCKMGASPIGSGTVSSIQLKGRLGQEKVRINARDSKVEYRLAKGDKSYDLPTPVNEGEEFSIEFLNDNGPRDVFVTEADKFLIRTGKRSWPSCPTFTAIFRGGRCDLVRKGVFA
ncbi:unnamed protein product, partial [Amoebophrya sp. A120]